MWQSSLMNKSQATFPRVTERIIFHFESKFFSLPEIFCKLRHSTMIIYKNKYLTYGLAYYNESSFNKTQYTTPCKIDIIRESQYTKKKIFSQEFYTLLIDLTLEEDKIFSSFEKNTQYEIKRSKNKDGITTVTLNAKEDRYLFYNFYEKFAKMKNLHPLGTRETDMLIDNDMFTIRAAIYNDEKIVFHTYITANNKARLAQSSSFFRESTIEGGKSLIGRANRFLHWDDILYFKERGYSIYDLGGISKNSASPENDSIDKFKKCFGGSLAKEYNSTVPVSLKGHLYLLYRIITGKGI
jgi:hypothetical protein